eukprot:13688366-Alexandrium_andersonii.AAC.1
MAAEGAGLAQGGAAGATVTSVRLVGDWDGRLYALGGASAPPGYRVPIGGRNWAQRMVDHATPLHRL